MATTRGRLRVYVGAAPGVGKTHAMLDEGCRRAERGTVVVVGAVDVAGRRGLTDQVRKLIVPAGGADMATIELDVAAVLALRPDVVLIDDMARRVRGRDGFRWQHIDELLNAGVDVVTTVNISDIESLRDVVASISGTPPAANVPDAILRSADQLEYVDMSPEALRRRLAHGHIYPPEVIDATRAHLFRADTLGALRQTALLWMADRVEEDLSGDEPVESRERVVVALDGRGGDVLVRRAARLAGRVSGRIVGVHVVTRSVPPGDDLESQRRAVVALGGTYREIVADDVATALARFAQVEHATQVVIGGSGSRRRDVVVQTLLAQADGFDVHVVRTDVASRARPLPKLASARSATPPARAAAWVICLAGLPLLTALLASMRDHVSVATALLLDLCVVVVVTSLGGRSPGLVASVFAFGLTNWYLTPPLHTFDTGDTQNLIALTVFVVITIVVSVLVDREARRSREAQLARAEAGALARSSATLVGAHDPLPDLLEHVRLTFDVPAASILERTAEGWRPTAVAGQPALLDPGEGTSVDLAPGGSLRLVLATETLAHDQLEVLRAFADQLSMAVESRRLRAEAANAELLAEANALREALLRAVSHDFRTPIATIKASATGLLQTGVEFSDEDRRLLLTDIDESADRLDRMVRDLLDMSRLHAGAVELTLSPVALEEVVGVALDDIGAAADRVELAVSDSLPMVLADAALLERVVANLVSNAVAWSPPDATVRIEAGQVGDRVDLRVVDRGPGVPVAARAAMFTPFQRFGDRSTDAGVGLGLAIARGFVDALGAELEVDDTPGGGLTMSVLLRVAPESPPMTGRVA